MLKKILLLTGDGGESYETLYALHRFQEAGWEVTVAAPRKKRLHLVMHDFEPGWDTYVERQGYGLESTMAIAEAQAEEHGAVLVLGGRAPEYLRNDPRAVSLVRDFHDQGKPVFSICHGIQVLVSAGILQGRRVTCYEHVRPEVEACGGTWVPEEAVRDGKIVTAQTWQSHPWFYREVFRVLEPQ